MVNLWGKRCCLTLAALLGCAGLSGCYYWRAATAPMATQLYCRALEYQLTPAHQCPRAQDAMILLPGIGDSIERFYQEGLITQLRDADLPLDAVVADAHFGYYRDRTLLARLQLDVIEPAKTAGYRQLHFAGVSLGGFGSLLYWRDSATWHPASLTVLTPYLGEPEYYQFKLPGHEDEPAQQPETDKNLWPWLDQQAQSQRRHWYLGLARAGKFYPPGQLLANMLPASNVVTVPGEHDWPAWRLMWPPLLQALKRDFYPQEPSS